MTITTDAPVIQQPNILRALRAELGWSEERAAATGGFGVVQYLALEDLPVLPASSRGIQSILESAMLRGAAAVDADGRYSVIERMSETEVARIADALSERAAEALSLTPSHRSVGHRLFDNPPNLFGPLSDRRLIERGAETIKVVYEGEVIEELTASQRIRRTALGDAVQDLLAQRAVERSASALKLLEQPDG